MKKPCHCLYCGYLTGHGSGDPTVCSVCRGDKARDERREVEAGVSGGRPWARPLSFWVGFIGQKAMPDAEAAAAQARWDAEQERIRQFNDAHSGRLPAAIPAQPVASKAVLPKVTAA
jgi:hypothetical protein